MIINNLDDIQNFDFGFWTEVEDNEPKNDAELLQQVKDKLKDGEVTIDNLTQHEYDLFLSEDLEQFNTNVTKFLDNNAQFDSQLNVKTKNNAQLLIKTNHMNNVRNKKIQLIRKKALEDKIRQKKQINQLRNEIKRENRKIVAKVKQQQQIAHEKVKPKYIYIAPNQKLLVLEKYLEEVSESYEQFCHKREKQIQEEKEKNERSNKRWKILIDFIETLNKPERLLETIYGKKWVEIFQRNKNINYQVLELLEKMKHSLKDYRSLEEISKLLEINPSFSQGELLQIEDWILNSNSDDPVLLFMLDDLQLEKEVKNDIEYKLKLFICKNIKEEQKLINEENTEANYSLEHISISNSIRQKLLNLAIKIKEKCKNELEFNPKAFLNNWLRSGKRQRMKQNWYDYYLNQLKIFNEYLKLAFELNINDSNLTLEELIKIKSTQNKPKLTKYKTLPENKKCENVRKQHEIEQIQIAERKETRKIVQVPPKHTKIVNQVKNEIFPKLDNSHDESDVTLNESNSNKFEINIDIIKSEEEKNKPDECVTEYLNIIDDLADGIKSGKYKYEDLVGIYIDLIKKLNDDKESINLPNMEDKSITKKQVNNKDSILLKLKEQKEVELNKKQMKIQSQRNKENSLIEYRKIKYASISKPPKHINKKKNRTMNHVFKHIIRKENEIIPEIQITPTKFKIALMMNKKPKKSSINKRDPFIEQLDVKIKKLQRECTKLSKIVSKLENSSQFN